MTTAKTLLIFALIILTLIGCDIFAGDHPKDEEMLRNFNQHRLEFEQLLEMFLSDKDLGRIGPDFTRPASFFGGCGETGLENGPKTEVSVERLEEYRKRFRALGLRMGIEGYCDKKIVSFLASTKGLAVSGSTKGFAYLTTKPTDPVVDNLENYRPEKKGSYHVYRHIEGNWFLFSDHED